MTEDLMKYNEAAKDGVFQWMEMCSDTTRRRRSLYKEYTIIYTSLALSLKL